MFLALGSGCVGIFTRLYRFDQLYRKQAFLRGRVSLNCWCIPTNPPKDGETDHKIVNLSPAVIPQQQVDFRTLPTILPILHRPWRGFYWSQNHRKTIRNIVRVGIIENVIWEEWKCQIGVLASRLMMILWESQTVRLLLCLSVIGAPWTPNKISQMRFFIAFQNLCSVLIHSKFDFWRKNSNYTLII